MSNKLVGGSSGEPIRGANVPFFYPEVKAFEPNSKNSYGGRILPAFIFDDTGTPTGPLSMQPYRDANNIDTQTGKEKFTAWYFSLKGYKFVGGEKRHFLSPLTLHRVDKRGIDPLFDCYLTARTAKTDRPEWYKLTEETKNDRGQRVNAPVDNFRVFGAMNVIQDLGQQKFENRVCVVTTACLTDLKEQLDRYTPLGDNPSDPNWPRYLLGDITDPHHGLWFSIKEGVFNTAGMKTMLFNFSQQKDRLVGASKWPIDPASAWGQDVLSKRYNIADTDKVTKITSAQEILDYIVNDGFLPAELVHTACSDHWTVPQGHVNRTFSPPPAQPSGPAPAQHYQSPGAGYSAPAPAQQFFGNNAPANDGDLGPVAQQTFWVSYNGQTVPKPMTGAQLRGMVTSTKQDLLACLEANPSDWRPASQFGIRATQPTPPVAPTPPKPPVAPTGPTAPTPPPAPTAPTPPARTVAPPSPTSYAPPAGAPTTYSPPPSPAGGPPPSPSGGPPPTPGGGSFAPPPPPQSAPAPLPQQPPAQVPTSPPTAPAGGPPPSPNWPQPAASGAPMVQQAGGYPANPMHQQAPPAAPMSAPPAAPAAAPATNGTPQPLSQAEYDELMALEKKWESMSDGTSVMDPRDMNRYASLSDRYQALKQAGVAR